MNKSRTIWLRQALFSLPIGLLFLLGSMMYPSLSWAWGDLGHKIICQIAFDELNDKARNEVTRLIALDATFNSFTDACTWPDHPRKRAEEHFINVGRSVHTITVAQCPAVPKCLFTAIPADLDVLRTSNDDAAKPRIAQVPRALDRGHSSAPPRVLRGRSGRQLHPREWPVRQQSPHRLGHLHHREEARD